jgi:hypothetical protein
LNRKLNYFNERDIMPLWVNICFLMAVAIALMAWATVAISKKPTPPQTTPDEWLIEQLQQMDGVQVIEIDSTKTIEVTDKTGSSYGLEIGPALVVIVKRDK